MKSVPVYDNICQVIGNTPVVRLHRIPENGWPEMLVKLESFNPGGSVKDRIGLSMIEAAERQGRLKPGGTIVEPTSGNTGIGLAMVAAAKGYKVILAMPEEYSVERVTLLRAYGAQVVLTPREQAMQGAIDKAARRLAEQEGILCGISSGAILHASCMVAPELGRGKRVLAILPDTGERYLSTELWS